jgi:hypothetical protein
MTVDAGSRKSGGSSCAARSVRQGRPGGVFVANLRCVVQSNANPGDPPQLSAERTTRTTRFCSMIRSTMLAGMRPT